MAFLHGSAVWIAFTYIMKREAVLEVKRAEPDPVKAWAAADARLAGWAVPDPLPDEDSDYAVKLAAARRSRQRLLVRLAARRTAAVDWAIEQVRRVEAAGGRIVCHGDRDYPERLERITDAPVVLYLLGSVPLEPGPAVALVGSRRPTGYGLAMANRLAADLAKAGVTVISGMALGIDSAAHRGAMAAGGTTIAVLGTGIDRPYPPQAVGLYRSIVKDGLVVSEYPPGTVAQRYHFPERNRIISGLSRAVVVVEAGQQSGTRHTIQYAGEQGRDIGGVPGVVNNPLSHWPHEIIRSGGALIRSVDDILDMLHISGYTESAAPVAAAAARDGLVDDEVIVLGWLGAGTFTAPVLADSIGLAPARVAAALTMLELRGLVRQLPGGWFIRI